MSAIKQRSRARQNALDMVRTLVVVFAVVLPLWFLGQASPGDSKRIRPIDPSPAYGAYVAATRGPVPASLPSGWDATVAESITTEGVYRVGYVVGDHYLEWQGSTGTEFLLEATDHGRRTGAVTIGEASWERWQGKNGAESLVLHRGTATVLVGGVRETASEAELRQLAALVR
jgi:hypothetical protein